MKRIFCLFASMLTLSWACQQEELNLNDVSPRVHIYAETESFEEETKTSINSSNSVVWSQGDYIATFLNSTKAVRYQVTDESVGTPNGDFVEAPLSGGGLSSGNELGINALVYPFESDLIFSNHEVSGDDVLSYEIQRVTIPSVQTYQANSFPDESFIMVAVTQNEKDYNFNFRNASGALKLQLKGNSSVKSIEIKGNSDELLSGDATVIVSTTAAPEIIMSESASKTVTLDCGEGVQLNEQEATLFMMTLPPTPFSNGFTITITDTAGNTKELSTTKPNPVNRSRSLRMPTVTLESATPAPAENDYIDEYGVNRGPGVEIDGVVWAPVNCGYHETDYPWGKLYQWGRKYGQGYSGPLYEGTNEVGTISDATYPTVEDGTIKEGGVSPAGGRAQSNKDVFFLGYSDNKYDWVCPSDGKLWNSGTEENPVKTDNDPCPNGWRVPTFKELEELSANYSEWTENEKGQSGQWFSGTRTYAEGVPRIFLPAAGFLDSTDDLANDRGYSGSYFSSRSYSDCAYKLFFAPNSIPTFWCMDKVSGYSVRCVKDANSSDNSGNEEESVVPVSYVTLSYTSLKLSEGNKVILTAKVMPIDATNPKVTWSSDAPEVAYVDQSGEVTAISEGSATISATADGVSKTCAVTVALIATADYVDEYGKNHGKGIAIGDAVWAPVNCGYHETDYPYGKLYQWGRKYGQGYSGPLYEDGKKVGDISDATYPTVEDGTIKEGGVSLAEGQSQSNKDVFFTSTSEFNYDWLYPQDSKLWNSGTEENPVKTDNDPCPEGWRVPTYNELKELRSNYSSWTKNAEGQSGYWFSGTLTYAEGVPRIFLPDAGGRYNYSGGAADGRGGYGNYWSSRPSGSCAYFLCSEYCYAGASYMDYLMRVLGYSVRCVQATDEVAEL